MVINTPFGLYQYLRLPFGVASAPAIFQRYLEQLTTKIPMCVNYLDDIIVSGKTNEEHLQNLQTLFCTLQQNGLKCKLNKCEFFKSEITYLGHVMNWKGITPTDTHLEAIKSLPEPKDLKQLQSFMGKINYYVKFIKNAAHISAPLNELRKKVRSLSGQTNVVKHTGS